MGNQNRKSKKNRQHNGQSKKDKRQNNDQQKHYTENLTSSNTNPTKTECELRCSGRTSNSCFACHVTLVTQTGYKSRKGRTEL